MSRPKKPRNQPPKQYILEEAEGLQRQRDEETPAFFRAWLKKYGWLESEGPPNHNAEIILFPASRIRRLPPR